MTKESAIIIESLSKTYKLYHRHRDRIKELVHPFRKCYHRDYHALNNISLNVEKGEVIGIIGQNGSGKSTLLKILASVVTPTSGKFYCNGRITALLELGGGLNKDISGVDNIYFLGGIQGYRKKEMEQKLQEILDFADVGVYADQPVNSYSSGMYVRLAFSMAININPDILIIDEALAVGDVRFQQKCFRKIREFKDAGKTILFCSHNLGAVRDFCTRALWLHEGRIVEEGNPIFVTDRYNAFMTTNNPSLLNKTPIADKNKTTLAADQESGITNSRLINWDNVDQQDSFGTGAAKILSVALYDASTQHKVSRLTGGDLVRVYIRFIAFKEFEKPGILVTLNGSSGLKVFNVNSYFFGYKLSLEINKPTVIAVDFKFPVIGNGRYTLSIGILNVAKDSLSELHWIHDAIVVEVFNPGNQYNQGTLLVIEKATIETLPEIEN